MITSSDIEYIESKAIKKGLKQLEYPFSELADWIEMEFGVRPLNIVYDILQHNNQPRLQVIMERYSDVISFKQTNSFFKRSKEDQIQKAFQKIIQNDSKYTADNLYVIFGNFERIAKEEANSRISSQKIDELKEELRGVDIWKIKRNFSTGIFFFYTEEQRKKFENTEAKEEFKSAYFKLIKECDEFGYINKENFSILLDSKENFDNNYESNWFYYSRDN